MQQHEEPRGGSATDAPSRRARALAAITVAAVAGLYAALVLGRAAFESDFEFVYRGTELMLRGVNPYGITHHDGALLYGGARLPYPPPTLWFVSLLAWLPAHVAGATFVGVGAGLFAYAITRDGLWRLHAFVSGSFVMAASLGQWSPWIAFAALVPAAGALMLLKPSIGLAAFVARPSFANGAVMAGLLLVSVWAMPSWVGLFFERSPSPLQYGSPLRFWYAWPLLLAALRWRTPGGRLLLGMACVPQFLFFYDQVLLFLIPRTRGESLALTAMNLAGTLGWMAYVHARPVPYQLAAAPFVVGFCYLPALVLVLRHPNQGAIPAWLDAALSSLRLRSLRSAGAGARP